MTRNEALEKINKCIALATNAGATDGEKQNAWAMAEKLASKYGFKIVKQEAPKATGININTVKEVKLPRLADGAVFKGNDPYMAIVNDQKHGVNVESPLATIVEAMETALRTSDYSGSSTTDVNISFGGTLSALARVLNPYIEAETRRVGSRASTVKVVSV